MRTHRLLLLTAVALVAAVVIAPAAAHAAVRFTTPNGATFGDCTTSTKLNPKCKIERAVQIAHGGDSVALDSGTYTLTSTLVIPVPIVMQTSAGAIGPRVRLTASAQDTVQVAPAAAGTTISNIEFDQTNTSSVNPASALRTRGSTTMSNVIFNAHGPTGSANVSALNAEANTTVFSAGASVDNSGGALDAFQSASGVKLKLSHVDINAQGQTHLRAALGGSGALDASDVSINTAGDECINVRSPAVTLRNVTAVQNAGTSGPASAVCVDVFGGALITGLHVTASTLPADDDAMILGAASGQGGISATDVSVRTSGVAALLTGDPSTSIIMRRATLNGATGLQATGSRLGTGGPNTLVSDSALTGSGTAAVSADPGASVFLRHSDAVGTTSAAALRVAGCTGSFLLCSGPASLDVQNVIARAGGPTLALSAACSSTCGGMVARMSLNHSNFNPASVQRTGTASATSLTLGAGNQDRRTMPPILTDGVHQAASSPTVDHGAGYPRIGPTDIDGDPRRLGAATDIGADELVP